MGRGMVWQKSGGTCYICGFPMLFESGTPLSFTIEHWHPKSKGGSNKVENLVGTHLYCNQQKGNKREHEIEWEKFVGSCQWQIRKYLKAYPEIGKEISKYKFADC